MIVISTFVVFFALLFNLLMSYQGPRIVATNFGENAANVPQNISWLMRSPDFWLVTILELGVSVAWVWQGYMAIFAHSIYHRTEQASADIASAFPFGELAGLFLGMLVVHFSGAAKSRRGLYISSLTLLYFAALVPASILIFKVRVESFTILAFFLGFTTTQTGYVPSAVFVILAGRARPSQSVALFSSVLEGLNGILSGFFVAYIGRLREASDSNSFRALNIWCVVGLMVAAAAYATHIFRSWEQSDLADELTAASPDAEVAQEGDAEADCAAGAPRRSATSKTHALGSIESSSAGSRV